MSTAKKVTPAKSTHKKETEKEPEQSKIVQPQKGENLQKSIRANAQAGEPIHVEKHSLGSVQGINVELDKK